MVGGLEHVLFSHILGIIIPTDFYIFQRGGPTTNQINYNKLSIYLSILSFQDRPIMNHSPPILSLATGAAEVTSYPKPTRRDFGSSSWWMPFGSIGALVMTDVVLGSMEGKMKWRKIWEYNMGQYGTGWWFGTFFIFPYIGNNHPNWLIFFRGVQTTNQKVIYDNMCQFILIEHMATVIKWLIVTKYT